LTALGYEVIAIDPEPAGANVRTATLLELMSHHPRSTPRSLSDHSTISIRSPTLDMRGAYLCRWDLIDHSAPRRKN